MQHRSGENMMLPAGIALSWGLEKRPQRGPKRELSVRQIVDAAVAIADREGLSAVSMGKVAESLGFTAMSLYRYIPSKDDLLILMQEAVSEVPLPAHDELGDWREMIREYFRISVRIIRQHPWFTDIPVYGVPATPGSLRYVDWLLGALKDFPLHDFEKMNIILLLTSYARSAGIIRRDLDRIAQGGADMSARVAAYGAALKELVTPDRFPHLHPLIMSGVYTGEKVDESGEEIDFDFGLERILDGIEAYANEKRRTSGDAESGR